MPPPAQALPVQPGDLVADRYRVERVLGVGGMGVVVAARHKDLGHLVAIKLLLVQHADRADVVERFLREARATVQLRSEHAVRVSDVGIHQPRASAAGAPLAVPYMVMEHLEGKSLWGMLARGPLPVADAAEYIAQACEALEEAHQIGIIHRDLKPDNLFLTRRPNGAPLVKVLDFGISRVPGAESNTRLTGLAEVMGTPHYMAPEQMMSARNADARSDVWALGATLYELCTGRMAFPGDNVTEICTRVLTTVPASPRALRPDVPIDLEGLILRCLEKDPRRRPASAAQLAQALAPHRAGNAARTPADVGAAFAETEHAAIVGAVTDTRGAGPSTDTRSAGLRWALISFGATGAALAVLALVLVLARGREVGASEGVTTEPARTATSTTVSVTVAPAAPSGTATIPEPEAPAAGGASTPAGASVAPAPDRPASPAQSASAVATAAARPQVSSAPVKRPSSPFKDHR